MPRAIALAILLVAGALQPMPAASDEGVPVAEGTFTGSDGNRLYYRKVGSGEPTIVYLHGGPANIADGGYALDRMARGRTWIALQQRSGGRSELVWDEKRLTFDHYVADLEALRIHFGLERMMLAGNSFGGMVAAAYAAQYPNRVSRLMLWSPGPPNTQYRLQRRAASDAFFSADEQKRLAEIAKARSAAASETDARALCREFIQLFFRFYVSDTTKIRELDGNCSGSADSLRHEQLAMRAASAGDYDLLTGSTAIAAPTLVLEGADTRVPLDATRAWARAIPGARLLLIPHANHMLYLEGGDAFFGAVETFLGGDWPAGAEEVRD